MDALCKNFGALRCQKDRKFFIDLPKDFITNTVIPSGSRCDFLEKCLIPLIATITFQCTLMMILIAQQFNFLVTSEPTHTYFGCPGSIALATTYEMEARERAMLYIDYDRDEIMVYYMPAGSDDDGPLTRNYDPNSVHRNVELAS
ncbi:hypothetical protein D1007_25153 [Hordeum vulgare]|nr:hypothetical protein D1007_25153 [Hordeum vulgare]